MLRTRMMLPVLCFLSLVACAESRASHFKLTFDAPAAEGNETHLAVDIYPVGTLEDTRSDGYFSADFTRRLDVSQRFDLTSPNIGQRGLIYSTPGSRDYLDVPRIGGNTIERDEFTPNFAVEFCLYDASDEVFSPCERSDGDARRVQFFIHNPIYDGKDTQHHFDLTNATFERGLPSAVHEVSKCEVRGCAAAETAQYCEAGSQQHACETGPNVRY